MKYTIVRDDISLFSADALVLPSNSSLKEGSGTSKALFEKAGSKQLKKACSDIVRKYGKIYAGAAVPTLAYDLNANYIIHAVVPRRADGNNGEYELLRSAYLSSLKQADLLGCKSLAIPLLGTGHNGFTYNDSFKIANTVIEQYVPENKLTDIFLIVYGRSATAMLRRNNIPFEENIDDKYILEHDETYRHPAVKAARYIKDLSIEYMEEAIKICRENLESPEFRQKMVKKTLDHAFGKLADHVFGENTSED